MPLIIFELVNLPCSKWLTLHSSKVLLFIDPLFFLRSQDRSIFFVFYPCVCLSVRLPGSLFVCPSVRPWCVRTSIVYVTANIIYSLYSISYISHLIFKQTLYLDSIKNLPFTHNRMNNIISLTYIFLHP